MMNMLNGETPPFMKGKKAQKVDDDWTRELSIVHIHEE